MSLEVEFGEIVCEGITLEHHLFMKKDDLIYGTIFFENVVDYLLHHVTHVEIVKDAWEIFVQHLREYTSAIDFMSRAYNFKLKEGSLVQVHIEKLSMITNQIPNIEHQAFNEDLAFTFLKGFLLSMNLCGFI